MKNFSPSLLTFKQNNKSYNKADLFQISLPNGQFILANDSQYDIVFQGRKFYAAAQGAWKRGSIVSEAGFSLAGNSMPLTVIAPAKIVYPGTGVSLFAAAQLGLFDAALVYVYTVYWPINTPPPAFGGFIQLGADPLTTNRNPVDPTLWSPAPGFAGANLQVSSNKCSGTSTSIYSLENFTGVVIPQNGWASIRPQGMTGTNPTIELQLRASATGYYSLFISGALGVANGATIELARYDIAGTVIAQRQLLSTIDLQLNANDVVLFGIYGGLLMAFVNGVNVLAGADNASSFAPGTPALAINNNSNVLLTSATDFRTGSFSNEMIETKFAGYVKPAGSIRPDKMEFEVADVLTLLNSKMPRRLLQVQCPHTLYDPNCTLSKYDFSMDNSVASGSTRQSINLGTNADTAAPAYSLGYILMTSGQNSGFRFSIKKQNGLTNLMLTAAMPLPLAIGDTFTMFQGCDKNLPTCILQFNNKINFGGTPFVPNPEVAI